MTGRNIKRFAHVYCTGDIYDVEQTKDMIVYGKLRERVKNDVVYFFAANPPDYHASYTGSCLPYANESQAFENTPNKGTSKVLDGTFEVKIMFPNSYYVGLGTVIVPPTLYVHYFNLEGVLRKISIKLSDGVPYRMLTYPMQYTKARRDATFYDGGWQMPVRTQEQVLRNSAYPHINKMDPTFWGLKPPL